MILQSKVRGSIALLATVVLAVAPVWSQEEAGEEEESQTHSLSLAYEGWIAQPAGLDYTPATVSNPSVSVDNQAIKTDLGTDRTDRYAAGFVLPGNLGKINGYYSAIDQASNETTYEPGQYIYGEILAFRVPQGEIGAPGVNDDAFADGFLYNTSTTLREWAISYERNAFRTQRVEGRWSIGWRNTRFRRNQDVNYYAILSPLPPLLPPTADCAGTPEDVDDGVVLNCALSPDPDTASLGSTYDGRGPMARLDVDVSLWRDKLFLETGLGYTVQRGKIDSDFIGTNNYYICTGDAVDPDTGEGCVTGELVTYPYSQISQLIENPGGSPTPVSSFVEQQSLSAGMRTESQSASSEVLDIVLGLRWDVLDWFEVRGGFRSSRYSDVGLDLVPQDVTVSVSGALAVPTVETKRTSVTYEGFYVGFTFSFF